MFLAEKNYRRPGIPDYGRPISLTARDRRGRFPRKGLNAPRPPACVPQAGHRLRFPPGAFRAPGTPLQKRGAPGAWTIAADFRAGASIRLQACLSREPAHYWPSKCRSRGGLGIATLPPAVLKATIPAVQGWPADTVP
ncbi:MAG: hypothetical protein Kow0025_05050 [Thermodesulfovibrionales bacterium]